ncbi:sodium-dependent transporter [Devriesea agamarum]|uniref:sodium-dependent transporter n=1 Tax=Devriesea agamarum TaxID=472569 RepID=UPI00071D1BC5|nr:sodium-dependent transporter [Devriesea agamarum]
MTASSPAAPRANRGAFAGRSAFIFAAIGSAVGLGNIWRFPYVAYENGGGAFMIPYLVALLTAGIPLLFIDYAIGHRWRSSPPLAYRRLARKTEAIGWWQVLVSFVIAVYYAVIIAWAASYMVFSFTKAWGDDPGTFFKSTYTQSVDSAHASIGFDIVPGVMIPLVLVWIACILVLALGVQKGIGASSTIFIPILMVLFLILVVQSLFLPGASKGLEALFTPNWESLTKPAVWAAAYGQIFFSLSVAFGIMLTYSSYLKKKTDLTGSGLVVGFANSSFEVLAGIGVFAALGFMATSSGQPVSDVAQSGIGLAFIAFPTIINQAPAGVLLGVLFFASLLLAGFTSIISILEVVISAIQDKLGLSRITGTVVVCVPMAIISLLLFPTTTGLNLLDVIDHFVNYFGIVAIALVSTVALAYGVRALPTLRDHLNARGSFKVGRIWMLLVGVVSPILLVIILGGDLTHTLRDGYGDMPTWFVGVFGWGLAALLIVLSICLSLVPWSRRSNHDTLDSDGDPIPDPVIPGKGLQELGVAAPAAEASAAKAPAATTSTSGKEG